MKTIKKRKVLTLVLLTTLFAAGTMDLKADPPEAEDAAYKVAVAYKDRGFFVQPVSADILLLGSTIRVTIPVTRGLDYVIIAAGDLAAANIDTYVYSEFSNLIINDSLKRKESIVQFRAQYTGSVYAYIFMESVNTTFGLPSYAAFVGRRGNSNTQAGGSGGSSTNSGTPTNIQNANSGTGGKGGGANTANPVKN